MGSKEGPPTLESSGLLSGLPGLGEVRASSKPGPGPGPGTGESTPRMRWLIQVPRTDGRQCQQNGFWAAGWRIPPLSDLCCVLRGREPGPLPKLRCFRILPSSGAHSSAFLHSPVRPPRASPRHRVPGEAVRAATPLPRSLVHCLGAAGEGGQGAEGLVRGLRPHLDFLSPSPEACSSCLSRLVLIFPPETWDPFPAYGF